MPDPTYAETLAALSESGIIARFFAGGTGDVWEPKVKGFPLAHVWVSRHRRYVDLTYVDPGDPGPEGRLEVGFDTLVCEPLGVSAGPQFEVAVRFIGLKVALHAAHEGKGTVPGYVAGNAGGLRCMGVDH